MERIILDTDIGTDVDDVMAVALAAISPELKVEGVTTVYGDVDLRARMVVKVLKMLGRQDIPVFAGSRDVLLRYTQGDSFDAVVNDVHAAYDEKIQFDWCLTIPNAMLVTACILWHNNYDDAVAAAVLAGFDTDCNGATVGSVFGLAGGIDSIASKWSAGFAPMVNSSVHGYHRLSLDELCRRTEALARMELSLS